MQKTYYKKEIVTPLKGFCAVVEAEFNVKRAAERLHITTAAIHQQIRALEDSVGYQVFSRDKRIFSLTYGGKLLYQQVAPLLQQFFTTIDAVAQEINKTKPQEIRIAGHSTALSHLLPKIIKKFEEKTGFNAKFIIHDDLPRDQAMDMMKADELDLIIYPMYETKAGYETINIISDDPVIAMPRTHLLAKKSHITLDDLNTERIFYINPKYITLPLLKEIVARNQWGSNIEFSQGKWELLLYFVRAGLGIAFVSAFCIPKDDPVLIGRTLPQFFPTMPYNMMRKKGTVMFPVLQSFIDIAQNMKNDDFSHIE